MKSWVAAVFLEIFVIIWISARAIRIYGKYFQRCCWWKGCTLQHFQLVLHHSDCSFQRVRCCKVSPTYRHTCMLIHLLWFCGSRSGLGLIRQSTIFDFDLFSAELPHFTAAFLYFFCCWRLNRVWKVCMPK